LRVAASPKWNKCFICDRAFAWPVGCPVPLPGRRKSRSRLRAVYSCRRSRCTCLASGVPGAATRQRASNYRRGRAGTRWEALPGPLRPNLVPRSSPTRHRLDRPSRSIPTVSLHCAQREDPDLPNVRENVFRELRAYAVLGSPDAGCPVSEAN
jgi:hypothetical protein